MTRRHFIAIIFITWLLYYFLSYLNLGIDDPLKVKHLIGTYSELFLTLWISSFTDVHWKKGDSLTKGEINTALESKHKHMNSNLAHIHLSKISIVGSLLGHTNSQTCPLNQAWFPSSRVGLISCFKGVMSA